jgi:spore coat protein U-like protein
MTSSIRIAAASFLLVLLVTARAEANCTISTTSVAFGSYDVFSATPRDATGTVQIDCAPRENIQVWLSRGSSSVFSPRTLRSGLNVLDYNLFRNAARTQVWGDGSAGTSIFSGNNIRSTTQTVYGRVPAAQDAAVGNYTDTIVATVIF